MQLELITYKHTMQDFKSLGEFCQQVRINKRLSIKYLANQLKCCPATLSKFEKNKQIINGLLLFDLLQLLQIYLVSNNGSTEINDNDK